MKTNRKGFTITELVIVIVVIAILAAVLIPSFASLIKKANISADTQVAKNMNSALSMAEAEGKKDMTFSAAQAAVRNAGYILSSLNPTAAGNYFVWESDSNQILLVDKDMKILYKAKDIKDAYDTIDGGTWNIALRDTSLMEGIEGAVIVPALTSTTVNGNGQVVADLLAAGGTVVINEAVELTTAVAGGIEVDSAEPVTLDLNGQTVKAEFVTNNHRMFQIQEDADFTLSNGTITATGEGKSGGLWGVLRGYEGTNLTVENMQITYNQTLAGNPGNASTCKFSGSTVVMEDSTFIIGNAIGMEFSDGSEATLKNVTMKSLGDNGWVTAGLSVSYGGTLTIESGYYEAQGNVMHVFSSGGTINVKGGTFIGDIQVDTGDKDCVADSKIVISGGTFNGKSFSELTKSDWAELVTNEDSIEIDAKTGVVTITKNMVKGS